MKIFSRMVFIAILYTCLSSCQASKVTNSINPDLCFSGVCISNIFVENRGGGGYYWAELVSENGEPISQCPANLFVYGTTELPLMFYGNRINFDCFEENMNSTELPFMDGKPSSAIMGRRLDPFGVISGTVTNIEITLSDRIGGLVFEYAVPENNAVSQAQFVKINMIYSWPEPPDFSKDNCAIVQESDNVKLAPIGDYACVTDTNRVYDLTSICKRYPDTEQCKWLP